MYVIAKQMYSYKHEPNKTTHKHVAKSNAMLFPVSGVSKLFGQKRINRKVKLSHLARKSINQKIHHRKT